MEEFNKTIENILGDESYQFAYLMVLLVLIFIVAWKEGFKEWILSKIDYNMNENLISGRGEPDFWVIGNDLAASRREHMGPPLSLAAKKKLISIL